MSLFLNVRVFILNAYTAWPSECSADEQNKKNRIKVNVKYLQIRREYKFETKQAWDNFKKKITMMRYTWKRYLNFHVCRHPIRLCFQVCAVFVVITLITTSDLYPLWQSKSLKPPKRFTLISGAATTTSSLPSKQPIDAIRGNCLIPDPASNTIGVEKRLPGCIRVGEQLPEGADELQRGWKNAGEKHKEHRISRRIPAQDVLDHTGTSGDLGQTSKEEPKHDTDDKLKKWIRPSRHWWSDREILGRDNYDGERGKPVKSVRSDNLLGVSTDSAPARVNINNAISNARKEGKREITLTKRLHTFPLDSALLNNADIADGDNSGDEKVKIVNISQNEKFRTFSALFARHDDADIFDGDSDDDEKPRERKIAQVQGLPVWRSSDMAPDLVNQDVIQRAVGHREEKVTAEQKEERLLPPNVAELKHRTSKTRKKEKKRWAAPLVAVVEEHHDVIPYWFAGVEGGLLHRRGNVLVHIDAHSDTSPPLVNSSFPLFRYPHSSELVYLMQRNDMFIAGAALTGMFSRYIWIVPPWDKKLEAVLGDRGYSRYHLFAGKAKTLTRKRGREYKTAQLCYCVDTQLEGQDSAIPSSHCYLYAPQDHSERNPENPIGIFTTKSISRNNCNINIQVLAEIVTEAKALELLQAGAGPRNSYDVAINRLGDEGEEIMDGRDNANEKRGEQTKGSAKAFKFNKSGGNGERFTRSKSLQPTAEKGKTGTWLSEADSVILDIDEDYYGVEPALVPLTEAKVAFSVATAVSGKISEIFCPQNAQQEVLADKAFYELLDVMRKTLSHCINDKTCKATTKFETYTKRFSTRLRTDTEEGGVAGIICGEDVHEIDLAIDSLVETLLTLKDNQLKALQQVGICLRQSPNTMGFKPSRGTVLCIGYNRPGNSVVEFHVPDNNEIRNRSAALLRLLKTSRMTPRQITIARSVRDGYTPRSSVRRIEKDLLNILRNVFPSLPDSTIVYDDNLLGGRNGWSGRHSLIPSQPEVHKVDKPHLRKRNWSDPIAVTRKFHSGWRTYRIPHRGD